MRRQGGLTRRDGLKAACGAVLVTGFGLVQGAVQPAPPGPPPPRPAPPRPASSAEPISDGEAAEVRQVIRRQLEAFAADDASRAFEQAAPGIRQMFGSPQNFLQMVRDTYPVVYRPASVVFLKPERLDADVLHAVQMIDEAGDAWLAVYRMQRQRDRSWRINGCQLLENKGRGT